MFFFSNVCVLALGPSLNPQHRAQSVEFVSMILSSIVHKQRLCGMCFFPISFFPVGLHPSWWWDSFGWVLIIGRLFRIGQASLYSLSLEAYTGQELMMRYGLKMGNRFLLMKDEVTHVLYICLAIWPFLLADRKQE